MLLDKISFHHFRGLPSNSISLDGKNILVIGGNGKGKSSIVDGIELFFSADIGDTREINSYRHIKSDSDPQVVIHPQNAPKVTCYVNPDNGLSWGPANKANLANHPLPRNFILRRNKIISLIESQPSERFKYIMELLGEGEISEKRKKFQEAAKESKEKCDFILHEINTKYRILVEGFSPKNISDVLAYSNKLLESIGLEKIENIDGLDWAKQEISKKLNAQDIDTYAKLTNAIDVLKIPYNDKLQECFDKYAKAIHDVNHLTNAFADGKKRAIIDTAIVYLENNSDESICPVCGQEISPTSLLLQLKNRKQILSKLNEAISSKKSASDLTLNVLSSHISQLQREYDAGYNFIDDTLKNNYKTAIQNFSEISKSIREGTPIKSDVQTLMVVSYTNIYNQRESVLSYLVKTRESMLAAHDVKIKIAYDHISSFIQLLPQLKNLESDYKNQIDVYRAIENARVLVEKSCTEGLMDFLDSFSSEISSIYGELHDFPDDDSERSECTDIKLIPSRGRSPMMQLNINFLDKQEAVNPALYLSEGHLDSLGLSIFLASVLKFNPKGTLIVLDDVLTSIDSDHKHRVASILTHRFKEYQLIITTHDEVWARDVLRFAEVFSVRDKWKSMYVSKWDVDLGPYVGDFKDILSRAREISEEDYKDKGSVLRQLSESFMTEFVAGMQMLIPYSYEKRLTVENIIVEAKVNPKNSNTKKVLQFSKINNLDEPNNIVKLICNSLQTEFNGRQGLTKDEAEKLIALIFISTGDTLNMLSHWKPTMDDVAYTRVCDFISSIMKVKDECDRRGLLKKFQWQ